ncbi:MAG TPA: hypothetical protein VK661_06215 [Planctomycetota bacterium]|nr:hypothetical protein [Planctomycetota bacterium]
MIQVLGILAALTGLLLTSIWAIAARARPALLLVCIVGAGVFGWLSGESWLEIRRCDRIHSAQRRYEIDTSVAGDRVLRIDALAGVKGIAIWPRRKDGSILDYKSLEPCRWRARDSRGSVTILCDSSRGLLDIEWDLESGNGNRTGLELTYYVDENTKPVLQAIYLEAQASWISKKMCSAWQRDVDRLFFIGFLVATLISLAGAVAQVIRRVRNRRQRQTVPPA